MNRAIWILSLALAGPSPVNAQYDDRYTDDWQQLESEHFVLVGDANVDSMRRIASQLEEFRHAALAVIPAFHPVADGPTTVVVFGSEGMFRRFQPNGGGSAYFTAGPHKSYIAFPQGIEAREAIYHEYVHRLTRNAAEWPQWMREGTAEFYSRLTVRENGTEVRLGDVIVPHLMWLARTMMPLEQFLDPRTRFEGPEQTQTLYAESWAFLHYIMVGRPGLRAGLNEFLRLLQSGVGVSDAAEAGFGMNIETINFDFIQYVRSSERFMMVDVELEEPIVEAVIGEGLDVAEPEASSILGDLLLHIERNDEARSYLEHAIETAGEFAPALISLHQLYERMGETARADQFLDRAVRAPDPGYLARLLVARRMLIAGPFADVRPAAEGHLRRVVADRDDLAEGHFWLGQLLMRKEDGIAEAVGALGRALELDPLDPRIRLTYAEAIWLSGNDEAALEMIGELIATAGDPLVVRQARELADEIRAVTAIRRTILPQ